jgi:predicted ribosome quality control (RQC) complex YloA/Tae2 family protein
MADYPTGDWYRKYLMTYEDRIMEEFKKQIMKGTANETYLDVENNIKSVEEQLRERIHKLESLLEDTRDEIQIIQTELESILNALYNAVENGVQLNIGIVVGQTMSKLSDIIGK